MTTFKDRSREHYDIALHQSPRTKEWIWKQFDRRNRLQIGGATETYKNRIDCIENCYRVTGWLPDAVDGEFQVVIK